MPKQPTPIPEEGEERKEEGEEAAAAPAGLEHIDSQAKES